MGAVQTLFWGTGWVGPEWWRRGQVWGWASLACWKLERLPWRREWQPTPVFLPGEFHGQRSLGGYSPGGHKELNVTEQLRHTEQLRTVRLTVSWIPVPLISTQLTHRVWLFAIPWTVARQTSLSMELSRREYWSRLPFPLPGESSRPRDWTHVSCSFCV